MKTNVILFILYLISTILCGVLSIIGSTNLAKIMFMIDTALNGISCGLYLGELLNRLSERKRIEK